MPSASLSPKQNSTEAGVASWYGLPFDGRLTASGEVYHMEDLTAAHRTYPFGTILHVTNKDTGKTVDVRVNDRGPFVAGRIIDLSHRAAQTIAMPAVASVTLQLVSTPKTRALQSYAVQVGSFPDRSDAVGLMRNLQSRFGAANIVFRDGDRLWRVLVVNLTTIEAAEALQAQLGTQLRLRPSFVVMIDDQP